MPRQFKTARQINKLKVIEAAEKLGVSQPTLSAWEGERKSPSIDGLENMADLYGVTTDFLLGRSDTQAQDFKQPISLHACIAGFSWQTGMVCHIWMAAGECRR